MKYIFKKYIAEKEVSELDMENQDVVLGHNIDGWDYETIEKDVNKFSWAGESIEINIDDVIKELKLLKKKGANYVEIMYHCDHYGYNFTGLEMREATKEEVKAEKNKYEEAKKLLKEAEIEKLKLSLAELA